MKRTQTFAQKQLVLALQAAFLCLPAAALAEEDPAVTELTKPTQEVQVGGRYVSKGAFKFGEYNGLYDDGVTGDLGFKFGWKGDEESSSFWRAEGTNLGLENRRLEVNGGDQGLYNLYFVYDELPHRISDSYRTIFNGNGTTSLTLPSSYPAIATRAGSTANNAAALANWNNIQAPNAVSGTPGGGPGYLIPSLMHDQDIAFKRTKIEGGVSVIFMPGWEARFSARQDTKDGTKLTGYAFASASTAAMLVEPIHYKTTDFTGSVGYADKTFNFNVSYLYSTFRNDIMGWSAQTPFATGSVLNNQGLFSSAPDNEMQQLKVNGGYRFTQTTRLMFEGTNSRMTQNSSFNYQSGAGWSVPWGSPDAKVVNDTYFLKLTSRPLNSLNLGASYKYDHRDNQTPVRTYTVAFADSSGGTSAITNDPINWTKDLFALDAEYSFTRGQALKAGFQQETISRSTDGSGFAPSRTVGTANTNDFTLPTHKTREDIWSLEYRNSMVADLSGRVGVAWSERKALDYSMPRLAATTNDATLLTNAYYLNFRDFFVANRTRDKVRAGLNYQISDAWGVGATVDYNRDHYDEAALKVSESQIYNVDVSYTPSDRFGLNLFYSYEDRHSNLSGKYIVSSATAGTTVNGVAATNLLGGACNVANHPCILANWDWAIQQADKVHTIGLSGKYKGLFTSKLDVKGEVLYIHSRTPVTAGGGGSLVSDGAAAPNYTLFAPANYADITSKTIQLRLNGDYKLDKSQSLRAVYMYQYLNSSDWQYDAYTNPIAMQAYIGTGMTAPRHVVNVFGLSYVYNFQ